jgi:hypothetical protein
MSQVNRTVESGLESSLFDGMFAISAKPLVLPNRGDRIRTCDLVVPKDEPYPPPLGKIVYSEQIDTFRNPAATSDNAAIPNETQIGVQNGVQNERRYSAPCFVCGKITFRKRVRNDRGGRYCCSRKCIVILAHRAERSFVTPDSTRAERVRAQGLVNKRLRLGWFAKPDQCCLCGHSHRRISAHHSDYKKPDEVHWLCPGCHIRVHHNKSLLDNHPAFICDQKLPPRPRHRKGGRRLAVKKCRATQITILQHIVDGDDVIENLACGHTYRRPDDGKRHKQRRCLLCPRPTAVPQAVPLRESA